MWTSTSEHTSMVRRAIHCSTPRDRNFFLNLIKQGTSLSQLNQIQAQIVHNNVVHDNIIITKLIQKLLEFKANPQAKLLFDKIESPDLYLYNVLIKGLRNSPLASLQLYKTLLRKTDFNPDNFTYSFVIAAFSGFPPSISKKVGKLIHGHSVVSGCGSDVFVGSALVGMYASFSNIKHARKVFDKIPDPDTVLWNTIISGLAKNFCYDELLGVFRDMIGKTKWVDSTTIAVVLSSIAELQNLRGGMVVQALAMKVGCHFDQHVLTCLLSLYSKCGDISTARLLFGLMRSPDVVSYNAMISAYSCNDEAQLSVDLFRQLRLSDLDVTSSTIVGLIPVFHPFGFLDFTRCIHGFCIKSDFINHCSVSTALMTVYTRVNELEMAKNLFGEATDKPLASWNAMISGYTQNGEAEKAISLFKEMQKLDIRPNPVTITTVLSACAQLGVLALGKWVHSLIKNEGFESNIYVSTSLIDMYMKCGSVDEATTLFNAMGEKNIVTWNAMINGYGLHGHGNEALKLYQEMVVSKIPPTNVTFLSVLYACSHSGLVQEGERIFHSMVYEYGFEPKNEHYACMVDILGRAGRLNDAMEFIKRMPIEPSPAEWGALLGACMIHKNTSIARFASDCLFDLDPESLGYHVLLSNIYSTNNEYPQAESLREAVKRKKMIKTPGCSLIEVQGSAHIFRSSDRSHPMRDAIYEMLERIMRKMRDEGYVAEGVGCLHDVEEEEKEMIVSVHSEKLAIAFGLIMCEKGEEIRIIKNLRVCLDCHNFTKFVSRVTSRVLLVRDANRFHRFQNGECSCADYW